VQLHFAQNLSRAVTNNLITHFLVAPALPINPFPLLPGSPEAARSSIQQQHHHKSKEDPHDAEDRGMHKEKIQGLEREWEEKFWVPVERQDRLEQAYRYIGQFCSHLGPLRSWTAKLLDNSEPVHDDIDTTDDLMS